jgi:hypothetical protein
MYLATEPLVGLAQIRLAQQDLPQAKALVKEILDYLDANSTPNSSGYGLAGTDNPAQIYQTCCRVLHA